MKKTFTFLLLLLAIVSFKATAQDSESGFKANLIIDAGVEYGGDEILKVFFTGGGDQSMKAGQGLYIAAGGQFLFNDKFFLRGTVGIKYNTTAADNANIRLTRVPINVMGYYGSADGFHAGIGVTTHQLVRFKGDGYVDDEDLTSNVGPRVEIGYKWIGLTYTSINYISDIDEEFSASSLGASLTFLINK